MPVPMQHHFRSMAVMVRAVSDADHVLHVGEVFFQHAAFVVRHFRDVAGHHRTPSLGKYVKALVCSIGVTSAAPSATGNTGGMFEVIPNLRA